MSKKAVLAVDRKCVLTDQVPAASVSRRAARPIFIAPEQSCYRQGKIVIKIEHAAARVAIQGEFMGRRRNEGLLELLVDFPWWVSVIASAMVYVFIKAIAPATFASNMHLSGLANGLSGFAGLFAALFLVPAGISFFRQVIRGKNLEAQRDLVTLRKLSWREFEGLVGEAFRRRGYFLIEQGGNQPDGGIDLILRKDGKLYLVQCKHWQSRQVGVPIIREQFGILSASKASTVFVVTSGTFTEESKAFAADKPIELIDGPMLLELVGNVQQSGQAIAGKTASAATPVSQEVACPKCGSEMKQRTAKQGANAGQPFLGCVRFPACRGTRAM